MPQTNSSTRKRWYLIAYDIRCERRLSRLHYFLKNRAVALQRSVFLLHATGEMLSQVTDGIRARVKDHEDDVRLYPIDQPGAIWAAGKQQQAIQHLYLPGPAQEGKTGGIKGLIKRLFTRSAI